MSTTYKVNLDQEILDVKKNKLPVSGLTKLGDILYLLVSTMRPAENENIASARQKARIINALAQNGEVEISFADVQIILGAVATGVSVIVFEAVDRVFENSKVTPKVEGQDEKNS
jgi:hypothetical protein